MMMKAHLALLLTGALVLGFAYGAPSKSTMTAHGIPEETFDPEQSTSLSADTSSAEVIGDLAPAPEMSEPKVPADKSPSSMSVSERMKARREQIAQMGFATRALKADPKPVHRIPDKFNKGEEPISEPEETSSDSKQGRSMQHGSKFSNRRSNSQNSMGGMKQQTPPASNNGNNSPAVQPAPAAHRTPMRRNPASRSSSSWNGNGNNAPVPAAPAAPSMPQKSMGMSSSASGKRNWSPGARKAKEITVVPTVEASAAPETAEVAAAPSARDSRSMRRMPSRRMASLSTSNMMAAEGTRDKRSPKKLTERLGKPVAESMEPEVDPETKEKTGPRKVVMRRTVGAVKSLDKEDKSTEKATVSSEAPLEKHDEQVLKQIVEKVKSKENEDDDGDDRKTTIVRHVHSAECLHKHNKPSESEVITLPPTTQKTVSLVTRTQSVSSSADEPIIEQFHLVNEKSEEPRAAEKEASTSVKAEEPKKEEVKKPVEEAKKSEEPKQTVEEAVPAATGDSKKSEEPKVEVPESDKKAIEVPVKVETTEKPEKIPATTVKPEETPAAKTETNPEEAEKKKTEEDSSKKPEEIQLSKTPAVPDEFEAAAQKEAELALSTFNLSGGLDPQAALASTEKRGVDGGREPQHVRPVFVRRKRDSPSTMMKLPEGNGMTRVKMGEEEMSARNMPMMRRRRSTGYGQKIRNSVRSSGSKQVRVAARTASYETPAAEPETYTESLPAIRSSTYGRSLSRAPAQSRPSNYEAPAEAAPSSYETLADPEETYEAPAIQSTNYEAPAPIIRSTYGAPSTYEASSIPVIRLNYFPVTPTAPPATRSSTYGRSISRSSHHETPAVRTSTYEEETPALLEESYEVPSAPAYEAPAPQAPAAYPEEAPPPSSAYPSKKHSTRLSARGRPPVRTAHPASSEGAPGAPAGRGNSGAPGASSSSSTRTSSSHRSSAVRHAVRHGASSSSRESSPTFEEVEAALKSIRSSSARRKSPSTPPTRTVHRVKSQDESYGSSLFDEVDTTNYEAAPPAHHEFQEEAYGSHEVVLDEETPAAYSPPHVPSRKLPIRISKERYRRSTRMGRNKPAEQPAEAEPTTTAPSPIKDFDDSVLSKLSEKRPSAMKSVKDILAKKAPTKAA